MQITIITDTAVNGEHVAAGSTIDADETTARYLCHIGKAVPAADDADTTKPRRGKSAKADD